MALAKKARDPLQEIQNCLQRRDYKGALPWFSALLEKNPKNTQIRLRFADTLVLAGSKNEALKQYRLAADEMAEAGFMIRAIAINKKIVQLDPSQSDVHQKLAAMNVERSRSAGPARPSFVPLVAPPASPARPAVSAPKPPAKEPPLQSPAPTLSLEESLEMEFGTDAIRAAEIGRIPSGEEQEPLPEIALEPEAGGFEMAAEREAGRLEMAPEREPAGFEIAQDAPSFSVEPAPLGEAGEAGSGIAIGQEVEPQVELVEEAEPGIEEVAETEPEAAADGATPLVGLLGENVDSLIDAIIADVGDSRSKRAPARGEAPTHIPLFSDLTAQEFVEIATMLARRAARAGSVIFKEGDPGDSLFIVSTGEVLATRQVEGKRVEVASFRDGDFFGEMAALTGQPRRATVTTVKNTELLELSRDQLAQIFSRHPEIEAKIRLAFDERLMRSGDI